MHRFSSIRRFFVRRHPGQSIVVIAFMLVIMVGFVGLSVDVGNAYGQQRRIQSGTNAAAVAGMLAVQDNTTNSAVLGSIRAAMQGHGFNLSDTSHYNWTAYYIVPDVTHPGFMTAKNIASAYPGSAAPPSNIANVAVTATDTVDSYFAKVVGRPNLPAHAVGYACNATPTNLYPISVPFDLSADSGNQQWNPATWNYTTHTGTQISPANSSVWTVGSIWSMNNSNGKNGSPGAHVGYWHFNSNGSNSASTLDAQMAAPGSFHQGAGCGGNDNCYVEAGIPSPALITPPLTSGFGAVTQANNKIEPYDYVSVYPGVKSSVLNGSNFLNHMTSGDTMILPMTSGGGGNGANAYLQIEQLGRFRLLASSGSNNGGVTFQYLGTVQSASPVACTPTDTAGVQ